jgi:hypothetical protein
MAEMEKKPDHTIRLRGPWQYAVVAQSSPKRSGANEEWVEPLPQGTIHIPADWSAKLGSDFCGRVRYSRNFGKPTGLEMNDHVELVCDCVDPCGCVELNGSTLGSIPLGLRATRFDITQLLQTRNQLIIDIELPAEIETDSTWIRPGRERLAGGIVGEVRLEIFHPKASRGA